MTIAKELLNRMMERFGGVIDLKEHPEALDEIVNEVVSRVRAGATGAQPSAAPFGVSWMDSWVAHWIYSENLRSAEKRDSEVATVLRGLLDLKFSERLNEIRRHLDNRPLVETAPDGGPPEPGTPPAGPAGFRASEPGTPPAGPTGFRASEPGTPGVQPSRFEPPDGGPPEPGTPPAGPSGMPGSLGENPWILYWFVSIRAPMLLEVIDLHLTRRLQEMRVRG